MTIRSAADNYQHSLTNREGNLSSGIAGMCCGTSTAISRILRHGGAAVSYSPTKL